MYTLKNDIAVTTQQVIIIARTHIKMIKRVIDQVKFLNTNNSNIVVSIFFVPRVTLLCKRLFHEHGLKYELNALNLDVIALDDDLMSMELPHFYRDVVLVPNWNNSKPFLEWWFDEYYGHFASAFKIAILVWFIYKCASQGKYGHRL